MEPLARAHTALALLALDPALGGLTLRARSGAVRDAVMAHAPRHSRLHPAMGAEALDGGIDVTATLSSGTLTQTRGAARARRPFRARDGGAGGALPRRTARRDAGYRRRICSSRSTKGSRRRPCPLPSPTGSPFTWIWSGCAMADITAPPAWPAPADLAQVRTPEGLIEALVVLSVRLGISSLRAAGFALRAARAHAALNGRLEPIEEDITAAVALVLAHRATRTPTAEETPEDSPQEDQPPTDDSDGEATPQPLDAMPLEMLLDAVLAALPADLLANLQGKSAARTAGGSGAGQKKTGNRRGRPLPARDGGPAQGRVDLIATLRAAIPWQTLRKREAPDRTGPIIRHADLRRKRFVDLSDRVLIFAVDASGSAAMARMGEAKGAVELLLAQAYARRDHVALIAFRGSRAEVLLEPTRSLVQTKRKLADLPGGGATPLATGLLAGLAMAQQVRRKGMTPTLITLTDGRANMALDGTADRTEAAGDAQNAARALRAARIDCIVIDTGRRPEAALADLSDILDGTYIALPRADARKLSDAVTGALDL